MSLITDALGGSQVKMVIGLVLVTTITCAAIGVWWHIKSLDEDVSKLQAAQTVLVANNKILQQNNDTLKGDLITAQDMNATDNKTITDLLNERSDAQDAVTKLASQTQTNKARVVNLQKMLDDLKKNPANNGTLAPVLRETVRNVEKQ